MTSFLCITKHILLFKFILFTFLSILKAKFVLLFTISTQPFMLMLKEQADLGNIVGVQLGNGKQLTHQLFVDDTGIFFHTTEENFWNIREVIAKYEAISGACLNPTKSIVIPMYLSGPIPDWMLNVGCKISQQREVITYLGCPIGYGITTCWRINPG